MANNRNFFYFKKNFTFIVLFLMMSFVITSCASLKKSEAEKAQISEEKDIAKANSEIRALQKAHYKRQAPDTKKMMKRSKKHARKLNRVKTTL